MRHLGTCGPAEDDNIIKGIILVVSVPWRLAVHLQLLAENHLIELTLTGHQCLGLEFSLPLIQNLRQQRKDLVKLAFLEKILGYLDQFGCRHPLLEWWTSEAISEEAQLEECSYQGLSAS